MKQRKKKFVWLVVLLGVGSIQAFGQPFAKGPYLGQTPPGPIAEVFAPGLICHAGPQWWESHGHFSADGNTFCFTRRKYVYITENTDQGWTTPERIESIPCKLWSPCMSPDANSVYFMPYSLIGFEAKDDPSKRWRLHRCVRTAQGWSSPRELGPPFSAAVGGFCVGANNNIYFTPERGLFGLPLLSATPSLRLQRSPWIRAT